jgi:hypothetical protein
MIASIMANPGGVVNGPSGSEKDGSFNFADLLKGAGGKLGDFLQRWGLGLQGLGAAPTKADIQQAQQFELQKQQSANTLAQRNMMLDNQYQQQRMGIQQQYNKANLTQQEAAERDNRLAEIDANYQNDKKLLPQKVEAELASARAMNTINQKAPNAAAATVLGGK